MTTLERLLLAAVAFGVLMGIAFLLTSIDAQAHNAPSGMSYAGCCNGKDCGPVSDSSVKATSAGWVWRQTGEVVARDKLKDSTDGRFHRCFYRDKKSTVTRCLYVPPMSQ